MRKRYYIYLIIFLILSSCARERTYVKVPESPPSKAIALPGEKGEIFSNSYVVNGERFYVLPDSVGFVQTGGASWYGEEFHGRKTSSGEIYDMHKKSAAHKTLPLGTYVKVTNLSNNRHTIVRINDRGPFVKGRIIDLSYEAAKEIRLIGPGVATIKIAALGKEVGETLSKDGPRPLVELKDLQEGEFTIQVGAFKKRENAVTLADRLRIIFDYVNISRIVDEDNNIFFRLHVSKSKSLSQAGELEKRLEDMGFTDAFIVRI